MNTIISDWLINNRLKQQRIENENLQRQKLKRLCSSARQIIFLTERYGETHPIYSLVKSLIDVEQSKNTIDSFSMHDEKFVDDYSSYDLLPAPNKQLSDYVHKEYPFPDKPIIRKREDIIKEKSCVIDIDLTNDSILTRPWNFERLERAVSCIGSNKKHGEWVQDNNHRIDLWLPFGLSFVNSGNHSITTGILDGEGIIRVDKARYFKSIFSYIYCDGVNYFRKCDGTFYASVSNFSLAVVFEIGRIITESDKEIRYHGLKMNGYCSL